ncbi:MAG: 2-polyprenyl-3-methyl-6-methoxy-1,4-benzoquinone monooxygenase [Gammaproteobacteria bacterium]|nr:2-polyprenyl-3-methyl-6-methoxy-1,4-benzoquinone monooxygenase [Gammaproteobacteria bacterium]
MNRLDQLLSRLNTTLHITLGPAPAHARQNPAHSEENVHGQPDRRHAAGLMRVNHSGEVCAQALYSGQAFASRNPELQQKLAHAAEEELDHLAWCAERLQELGSQPSRLNVLWYGGSWLLGAVASLAGERWNLGFLEETERQVEAHLQGHLERLPEGDQRSREIVAQMKIDEAEHADMAREAGAASLPEPVRSMMSASAGVMKWLAYRL